MLGSSRVEEFLVQIWGIQANEPGQVKLYTYVVFFLGMIVVSVFNWTQSQLKE